MDQKTDTRSRILNIAEAAVLEKGFEATSIDEIVAAAIEDDLGDILNHASSVGTNR